MLRTATRRAIYVLLLAGGALARTQDLKLPDTPEVLHIAPPPSDRFPAQWYPRVGDGSDVSAAPVVGNPYTAIIETVTPYKSPSGEPSRQITRDLQARDRFGRTRSEGVNGGMTIAEHEVKTRSVIVADPVSHCDFHWTEPTTDVALPAEDRVAFVTCGPQTLRYKDVDLFKAVFDSMDEGISTIGDTTTLTEHLAPLQVDGITVNRLRVTNTIRDEKGGDKRWSVETWYSPDLRELIRSGNEKDGYVTLVDLHRTDPDPKLFYPPGGFRIEVQPAR